MREGSIHSLEIISVTQLYHEQLCTDLQFIHALKISVFSFFLPFFYYYFFYTSNTLGIYHFYKRPKIQHLSSWHSHYQDVLPFAVCAPQAGNLCLSSPAQKQVTQSGTSVGLILKDCLLSICPLFTHASPHATLLLCWGGTKKKNNYCFLKHQTYRSDPISTWAAPPCCRRSRKTPRPVWRWTLCATALESSWWMARETSRGSAPFWPGERSPGWGLARTCPPRGNPGIGRWCSCVTPRSVAGRHSAPEREAPSPGCCSCLSSASESSSPVPFTPREPTSPSASPWRLVVYRAAPLLQLLASARPPLSIFWPPATVFPSCRFIPFRPQSGDGFEVPMCSWLIDLLLVFRTEGSTAGLSVQHVSPTKSSSSCNPRVRLPFMEGFSRNQ